MKAIVNAEEIRVRNPITGKAQTVCKGTLIEEIDQHCRGNEPRIVFRNLNQGGVFSIGLERFWDMVERDIMLVLEMEGAI